MHILMGVPVSPQEAERKGFVHETVKGKALDRALQIARHLSSFTPESLAYIKRLVRSATETPLAQGLLHERRLFMKLCISDAALSRCGPMTNRTVPPIAHYVTKLGVSANVVHSRCPRRLITGSQEHES